MMMATNISALGRRRRAAISLAFPSMEKARSSYIDIAECADKLAIMFLKAGYADDIFLNPQKDNFDAKKEICELVQSALNTFCPSEFYILFDQKKENPRVLVASNAIRKIAYDFFRGDRSGREKLKEHIRKKKIRIRKHVTQILTLEEVQQLRAKALKDVIGNIGLNFGRSINYRRRQCELKHAKLEYSSHRGLAF